MHEPLVSIIIPIYNRSKLIGETLVSVIKQTHQNWECIVVDDGSTDDSAAVIQSYIEKDNRIQLHHRPKNRPKGANSCRNYGFELSKGQYINWFDSDDIMHPDYVKIMMNAFKDFPEVDALISKTYIFQDHLENVLGYEHRTFLSENLLEDFITLKISWYIHSPMWRRNFLINKRLFTEGLLAGQDRDFNIRMLLHEPNLKIIDEYLVYYRRHSNNITTNIFYNKNKELKISLFYALSDLISDLKKRHLLSPSIKYYYFHTLKYYLPTLYIDTNNRKALLRVLKTLSSFNLSTIMDWIKIYLALISLMIFGKGEAILKW